MYLVLSTDITLPFYLDQAPVHGKAIRISIDTLKAVDMGIKFFHTHDVQLFASGDLDDKIPLKAFKSVSELEFTKETLS
jgi:hypothetical protein